MRIRALLVGASGMALAVAAACGTFEDAGHPPPQSGLDAEAPAADGADGADGATPVDDAGSPACVPEPIDPFDAGPEDAGCGPGGQVLDLQTSKTNCGFCGNVCGATDECTSGNCVGTLVATGDDLTHVSSAITPTDLYFSTGPNGCASSRILRLPLAGGAPVDVLIEPGGGCISQVGIAGDRLFYWHSVTGVHATPLANPQPGNTSLVVGSANVYGFHVNPEALFWRTSDDGIARVLHDGGAPSVVHGDPSLQNHRIVGDDDRAFWTTGLRDGGGVDDQSVWTRSNAGPDTFRRIGGLTGIAAVTLDETYLYIASRSGKVHRLTKNGLDGLELVTNMDLPSREIRAFTVSGDYLFMAMSEAVSASNGPFDLYRAKKCGGRARRIARDYMFGSGLVAAGGFLYFSRGAALARLEITKR